MELIPFLMILRFPTPANLSYSHCGLLYIATEDVAVEPGLLHTHTFRVLVLRNTFSKYTMYFITASSSEFPQLRVMVLQIDWMFCVSISTFMCS